MCNKSHVEISVPRYHMGKLNNMKHIEVFYLCILSKILSSSLVNKDQTPQLLDIEYTDSYVLLLCIIFVIKITTSFHCLHSYTFVICLIHWTLSPAGSYVSWCWSCFVCSELTYEIYSGGGPSMYVYCVVCYHVLACD